jgi:hypothetical protein
MHHLENRRACQLYSEWIPTLVTPAENPMLTLEDFQWLTLHVEYNEPVPTIDWTGPTTTTTESIRLCPRPQPQQGDLPQQRSFQLGRGISVDISFYWPPPQPVAAGYTAPLVRWVETVITGYTTAPIVLHDWHSQTYRPEHHNFAENFIFEPQLEPNLAPGLLDELRTKNIRMFYFFVEPVWQPGADKPAYAATESQIYGFDDEPFLAADLDADKDVDGTDFALFAMRWSDTVCDDCAGADLTGDGCVSPPDLWELAADWLNEIE